MAPRSPSPAFRIPRKVVFSLVTIAILLVGAEFIRRAYISARYAHRDPSPYSESVETWSGVPLQTPDRPREVRLVIDPLVVVRLRPSQTTAHVHVSSQGFRGREWAREKTPGRARVMLIGGSVAFGYGSSDDDHSLASALEARLRAALPGREVELLNGGQPGHTSAQELILYETELHAYAPDVVLVLDGFNDFYMAGIRGPEGPPLHPQFIEIDQIVSARLGAPVREALRQSALFRGAEEKLAGPPGPPLRFVGRDDALPRYERLLEALCVLAERDGARVIVATQPELFTRGGPIPAGEERVRALQIPTYGDYARARYPPFRDRARAVAAKVGARYVDASGVFDGSPEVLFIDVCHMNDAGQARLAEALCGEVAAEIAKMPGDGR